MIIPIDRIIYKELLSFETLFLRMKMSRNIQKKLTDGVPALPKFSG